MKSLAATIKESQQFTESNDVNIIRRLGVYEGLIKDLLRSNKIGSDAKKMILNELNKFPIPVHLESDDLRKLVEK
jgi:hypothetical protein